MSSFDQLLAHYQQLKSTTTTPTPVEPQPNKEIKLSRKNAFISEKSGNCRKRKKSKDKKAPVPFVPVQPGPSESFNAEEVLMQAARTNSSQEASSKSKNKNHRKTSHHDHSSPLEQSGKTQEKEGKVSTIKRVACKFFLEGLCKKSPEECSFSHDVIPNKTPEQVMKSQICKFHLRKACLKGEACPFSHDVSLVPCRFYSTFGNCREGEKCPYSHAIKGTGLASHSNSGQPLDYLAILDALDAVADAPAYNQADVFIQSTELPIEHILPENSIDSTIPFPFTTQENTAAESSSYNPFLDTN